MSNSHPMTLQQMQAAWNQQAKVSGSNEAIRRTQNSNLKAIFQKLKEKADVLHKAIVDNKQYWRDDVKKRREDLIKRSEVLEKEKEDLSARYETSKARLEEIYKVFPTKNQIRRNVNQTLKNKNTKQKLNLLGNLAPKSTLKTYFSVTKENRAAQGRNALIKKHFNLRVKNYHTRFNTDLQKLDDEKRSAESSLSGVYYEIERLKRVDPEDQATTYILPYLRRNWKSAQELAKEFTTLFEVHRNTLHSSFNDSLAKEADAAAAAIQKVQEEVKAYPPPSPPPSYQQVESRFLQQFQPAQRRYARGERGRLNSGDPNYDPSDRRWMY